MNKTIGIRHEDKYTMERRVAITPMHAEKLISKGVEVIVEESEKRVFTHDEFANAGAQIVNSLKKAPVIFGVKEMPSAFFEEGKTYVFFSHVIKGQSYNMPMLKALMEKKCSLIDYEKIENEEGKRLIFFGKFAGLAGAINSLWSLGQRLKAQKIHNPFENLKQAYRYNSLDEAKEAISAAGQEIALYGLPKELCPMVVGFTGYGNVSTGAQEIINLLPSIEITPQQLLDPNFVKTAKNIIYKVIFREKDLSRLKDGSQKFDLQDYYSHPERYENQFEQYIPQLSVLLNCMYWDTRYPRIVTKDFLEKLYSKGEPMLKVIGDITCDPDGSVECTHKGTEIEDPVFVYDPIKRIPKMGFEGNGVLVMAVDILPSELPRESSIAFGDALLPYVKSIAEADYDESFEKIQLPNPIKKALIVHKGKFTPSFEYISKYL
ncbi:MAG: bifunctional lysine ketoglutarate reductase /saccharopine dehydrogenase family protein [Bacteroidales bacterium]|nr:bifunctional lysine ketoglutarate reductase /saccharopine dehydrogenase family protein [Bacteroidales bacterium]